MTTTGKSFTDLYREAYALTDYSIEDIPDYEPRYEGTCRRCGGSAWFTSMTSEGPCFGCANGKRLVNRRELDVKMWRFALGRYRAAWKVVRAAERVAEGKREARRARDLRERIERGGKQIAASLVRLEGRAAA